jgi:methionyl-tRNA formyltransferase
MRIVFFGSPAAALPSLEKLLADGHEIPLIVTQPDHPAGRGQRFHPCPVKAFARERGIPTYEPEKIRKDPAALDRLRKADGELHVVVAYGQIMPGPIIDLPPLRSLNVHFSVLPKYRGAAPVAWAIRNGEPTTGITIFRLNEKMDEGDVFAAAEVPIRADDTTGSLEARLSVLGADLLTATIGRIKTIIPKPQDHALATLAPKLKKGSGLIDWSWDSGAIDRHIRAMNPWPKAFTFRGKERLIVLEGHPLPAAGGDEAAFGSPSRSSGKVLEAGKTVLRILCGQGTQYLVTRLQPEGRTAMAAAAYITGGRISAGEILSAAPAV